jgi:hypothetical protein
MNAIAWPVRFRGTLVAGAFVTLIPLGACGGTAAPEDHSQTQSQAIQQQGTFYDRGTQCTYGGVQMHCCPGGSFMIGARVDENVFKCSWSAQKLSDTVFIDRSTQCAAPSGTMHCCPQLNGIATVMVGLRADQNILACQQVEADYVGYDSTATIDANPPTQDGFPMHVCTGQTTTPPTIGSPYAMAGISIAENAFTCVN